MNYLKLPAVNVASGAPGDNNMTPEEAERILKSLRIIRAFVLDQIISYDKKLVLDELYDLIHLCQKVLAKDFKN